MCGLALQPLPASVAELLGKDERKYENVLGKSDRLTAKEKGLGSNSALVTQILCGDLIKL